MHVYVCLDPKSTLHIFISALFLDNFQRHHLQGYEQRKSYKNTTYVNYIVIVLRHCLLFVKMLC